VLLAVFAGVPGAERLFSITCLVVLGSVVIHGLGIAVFLRKNDRVVIEKAPVPATPVKARASLPVVDQSAEVETTITIDEVKRLQAAGEEVIILDARADRNRRNSDTQAAGSIRIHPHEPVRDATALRLSQRATLVVYCA
jgi:NhaP-type Na+/H+ or K+/H+ antiporter